MDLSKKKTTFFFYRLVGIVVPRGGICTPCQLAFRDLPAHRLPPRPGYLDLFWVTSHSCIPAFELTGNGSVCPYSLLGIGIRHPALTILRLVMLQPPTTSSPKGYRRHAPRGLHTRLFVRGRVTHSPGILRPAVSRRTQL